MTFHLCNPPKRSCFAIDCNHVGSVVRLIGTENVTNKYLVANHCGTDTRDSSIDAVVLGDLVRPDQPAAILLYGEEITAPVGKVNRVTIHGRSGRNISASCENPFRF